MGYTSATDISELLGDINRGQAIAWHLTSNHFPPVPDSMVEACIAAIDAWNDERDADKLISLPDGVGYRGLTAAPAHAIIEAHHLEAWLEEDE